MSINYTTGDIFNASIDTVIVVAVNQVGVMGAGQAAKAKALYPKLHTDYARACTLKAFSKWKSWMWYGKALYNQRNILCFPTKNHWHDNSTLTNLELALQEYVKEWGQLPSVAFPKVGCGLGGLTWTQVQPLMVQYLEPLESTITIYDRK